MREYLLRMHAETLKRLDQKEDMHLQAWLGHMVTATREQGKKQVPVYKTFRDFFDREKELEGLYGPKSDPRKSRLADIAAVANG
ncbi:hypothetical protein SAMN05428946_2729 [Edaphobacillus lindanitolerans]|uniref:Uncharacterized protein n=2 Tax=Edaphobacillus lindanitolerans TaxID=550447 RepID=A0A1U7PQ53_9BACI|nr:hypothetical protein SAMN05428946_2729 [Edaphobacillus lindanitolerans]